MCARMCVCAWYVAETLTGEAATVSFQYSIDGANAARGEHPVVRL